MPKILFLGTAGTIDAIAKTGKSSSSIYLESEKILIDPGPGTLLKLAQNNIGIGEIKKILLSSDDLIKNNDLSAIRSLNHDIKIIDKDDDVIKIIKTKNNQNAFIIKTTKYILSFIPEHDFHKKQLEEFKDTNVFIINCLDEFDKKFLLTVIEEISPELVILTGFGMKIIKQDPLEFSRMIKKELKAEHLMKTQIIPAKEEMVLNTDHYNIKLKQKSLDGFV
jgi:hypothetical protein